MELIKSQEMDSHKHSLVIFDEGAKEYNGAKVISQQMVS